MSVQLFPFKLLNPDTFIRLVSLLESNATSTLGCVRNVFTVLNLNKTDVNKTDVGEIRCLGGKG